MIAPPVARPPRSVRALRCAAAAWLLALTLAPSPAAGVEPKLARACSEAHYESQKLRDEGKLVTARKRLIACSQEACPRAVSRECAEWLVEVEKATPSIVLKAVDAQGHDVAEVVASEGGEPLELRPDGKAIAIDPGPHVYRFEHGGQTVEERVIAREGEQRRTLVVTFDRVNVPPPAPPTAAAGGAAAPAAPRRGPHLTPVSIALGGLALAAFGVSAYAGLDGRGDYGRLRDDCGRRCAPADVDDVRTKLIVADLSLGVGVASLAAATVLFLTSGEAAPREGKAARRPPGPALAPAFALAPGAARLTLGGAF